eukprot:scaffold11494_cov31-Tisochrysis_lutea.AAC.1
MRSSPVPTRTAILRVRHPYLAAGAHLFNLSRIISQAHAVWPQISRGGATTSGDLVPCVGTVETHGRAISATRK